MAEKPTERKQGNVESSLAVAVANARHLGSMDTGALALARCIAVAIDGLDGDSRELGALAARLTALLVELRLTPAAREGMQLVQGEEVQPIDTITDTYLRLVETPPRKQPAKRSKPRPAGGRPGKVT